MNTAEAPHTLRQRAIESATVMFVEAGYNGISMRQIAESLGVSKAALYYHFKDKQDLMVAILDTYLDRMEGLIAQSLGTDCNCRQQIARLVEMIFSEPPDQRAVMRLASQEMGKLDPEKRGRFNEVYHRKFIERIESILKQGVANGELRPMDTRTGTWVLLGMMYPFFYGNGKDPEGSLTTLVQQIVSIFLDGAAVHHG